MTQGSKGEPSIGSMWQDASGKKWVKLQASTDAQLAPLGSLALKALALKPGESVLDIGCGAGQTLLQLASEVGSGGRVVGLDISEPLISRAQQVAERALLPVELILSDAASHSFQPTFDALFSRFGLMFFDNPVAAFRNLRGALKTGGRLSFVCWQALELNPWASVPLGAVRAVDPSRELSETSTPLQAGPFQLADASFVRELLTSAGFEEVEIAAHETQVALGGAKNVQEAVDYSLAIGPCARFVAAADATLLPEFRAALSEAFQPFLTANGVWMTARTLVCTAREY